MDKIDILNRVMKTASQILEIPEERITSDLFINSAENWDSLGHLNLILAIEEEFNVKFLTKEIPELSSLKIITEAVEEKLQNG